MLKKLSLRQAILNLLSINPEGLTSLKIESNVCKNYRFANTKSETIRVTIGNLVSEDKIKRLDPRAQPPCWLCGSKKAIYTIHSSEKKKS
jgi:hypothetical protein